MRVSYRIVSVENVGLDKVYTVELTLLDSGSKTQVQLDVPPGASLEDMIRSILVTNDEVIFVEGS